MVNAGDIGGDQGAGFRRNRLRLPAGSLRSRPEPAPRRRVDALAEQIVDSGVAVRLINADLTWTTTTPSWTPELLYEAPGDVRVGAVLASTTSWPAVTTSSTRSAASSTAAGTCTCVMPSSVTSTTASDAAR